MKDNELFDFGIKETPQGCEVYMGIGCLVGLIIVCLLALFLF